MAEGFGALKNSVCVGRRGGSTVGTVHLHAKVAIGSAGVVAGGKDDASDGLFAADQMGCRRGGKDAAGGDDHLA